jgi:sulfite exporter TauE/SafE/plastocyanin
MNLWIIFLTGLTTGGLSCLAMQGGLLASTIANQKDDELEGAANKTFDKLDWLPVSFFLIAKIVSHTILGFLLGWLGSKIELSLTVRLIFQGFAALFMLATAGNLFNLHPIFRYVVLQPPKFLQKIIRKSSKSKAVFTPALLGFLTIFIPCGVTQAMGVLAITSGNPVLGAAIMFFFVLGTSPLFAVLGVATAKLSETFNQRFMKFAAITLVFLGLSSLNGIATVLDSPITFSKATRPITYFFSDERFSPAGSRTGVTATEGAQQIVIQVQNNGYSPNKIKVKVGVPVELTLQTDGVYSCASSFVFKAFDIRLQLGPTDSKTVSFTPTKKGKFTFTCSMGMYTGTLEVI